MTQEQLLRARRTYPFILIVAVTWFANFLHFTSFGFYEDDWYYPASAYLYPFQSWFRMLWSEVTHFYVGRPIQSISHRTFGYIGAALSSISVLYLFAFALQSFSALLLYRVLRLRFPVRFSIIASLIFILSPLTTIRQFLDFAFTIGPGLIFLFLAILFYSRGRKLMALVWASAALLTYESLFFIYLAAPLFRPGRFSRRRIRELLIHVAECAVTLVVYILVRKRLTEARITTISSGPIETIALAVRYCVFFTIGSFKSYLYAAWIGIREAEGEPVFYCLFLFVPAMILTIRLWPVSPGRYAAARRRFWLWTFGTGLLLTVLGYSLAYFHLEHELSYPLSGRDTRVSGAASIGSSILMAAMLSWIGEIRGRSWKITSHVLTVGFLSVIFLYSFVIQHDYIDQWNRSRRFLTQAIMLSPDVQSNSFFIIHTNWLLEPLFPRGERRPSIDFSRHGRQISMRALFGSDIGPRVFFVYSEEWSKYLKLRSDQKLYWTQKSFPGGWERSTTDPVTPGRVIVMSEDDDGVLTRSDAPLWVDGRQIVQVLPAPAGGKFESNWPYLNRSALLPQVLPDYAMRSVMSSLAESPVRAPVRIAGGLSLDTVAPAGEGGRVEPGPPLRVITAANSGYFAAAFPIRTPKDLFGARYAFLRIRVVSGLIGIGVVDAKTRFLVQKTADPASTATDVYLPVIDPHGGDNLIIYNAATGGVPSEVLIEDVALVVSAPAQTVEAAK